MDVLELQKQFDEAVKARQKAEEIEAIAGAKIGQAHVLELAGKYPIESISYEIESEYDDEGGSYLRASFSVVFSDGATRPDDDFVVDDLYELGLDVGAWQIMFDGDEYEGTTTITDLKARVL